MSWHVDILARGEDIGDLAVFVILVIFAAVGGIVKWLNKKATEQQAEMQRKRLQEGLEEDRRIEAGQKPKTAFEQQVEDEQTARTDRHRPSLYTQPDRPKPVPDMPMPQQPRILQPPQVPPAQARATVQQLRAKRRGTEPVVLAPARQDHSLVHAEVAMPSTEHHDPYAFRRDPGRPSIVGIPGASMGVDLSNPETLRQAVVFHELLGPPKAMRNEPEPWEL